jgi:hypothetical protein
MRVASAKPQNRETARALEGPAAGLKDWPKDLTESLRTCDRPFGDRRRERAYRGRFFRIV